MEIIQIWAVPRVLGASSQAHTAAFSPEESYLLEHSRQPKTGDTALLFLTTRFPEDGFRRTINVPGAVLVIPPNALEPLPEGKTPLDKVRNLIRAAMRSTPIP